MAARLRLLVASLGLVTLAACTGDGGGDSQPEPRPTTAPRAVPDLLDSECPPRSTPPAYPADGVIPAGAVAVRLCNGPHDVVPGNGALDPPDQLLTEAVTELVDAVNGLESSPEGDFCAGTGGENYVLWFLYPEGDARAVMSNTGTGCPGAFVTPERERYGTDLLPVFTRLLQAQRGERVPPGSDRTSRCNPIDAPTSPVPITRDTRLATAAYCTLFDGVRWRSAELSPRVVGLLNDDLATSATSEGRAAPRCRHRISVIVGFTEWGDRVRIHGDCGIYAISGKDRWIPAPATTRVLESLRLGAPYRQCAEADRRPC